MIEPIFEAADLSLTGGEPRIHEQVSAGSGKTVFVHVCRDCGTEPCLTFERVPGVVGVHGGTFDDPSRFEIRPDNARHIFLGAARQGTVIPPHLATFGGHFATYEGVPHEPTAFHEPTVFHEPWTVGQGSPER